MSDETLQQQIAGIGARYLKRTVGEVVQLRESLARACDGEPGAMKELAQLAHKIHGSGAMFGFESLSERAHEIERLAASGQADAETSQRLQARIAAFEEELRIQARSQGIE